MASPVVPLGVAGFLAALALVALLARPAHRVNQLFAALLLLRGASTAAYGLLGVSGDVGEATLHARLHVWYSLATPLLLVALAGELFLSRARRARTALLLVLAVATLALGAAHALAPGALVKSVRTGPDGAWGYDSAPLLDAFAGLGTLMDAVLVALAARACRSPHETALSRRQAALLGLAFAFVPVHNGLFFVSLAAFSPERLSSLPTLWRAVPSLVALPLVLACLPSLARGFEGASRRVALGLLALAGFLGAAAHPTAAYAITSVLSRAAFAGAAALALLRYGLAGLPDRARRRAEKAARAGILAAAFLLAGGLVLALLGLTTAGLLAAPLLGLAVLLLSPSPLVALVSGRLLLAPDDPVERAARLERERGAPPPADPPALLGRYRVERELGRGSTATVLLATDLLRDAPVVVKRFHAPSSRAALAEARALSALRHPRVVPLLDVERVGGEAFLVLGHVPGGTARDLLDREGPLPPGRAAALVLDVLDALAALHARGLVHGDVKAENVLLDAQGRAVLGDLGSARFVAVDATATGGLSGVSLSGAAPEVLRGERAGPASDAYAAAALLYRLLTGRHYVDLEEVDAFQARERILLDPPRLPDPRVPPALDALLRRALAKRPADRPGGAAELADALRAAL